MLRQRQPAAKNKKHVEFVRTQPCCIPSCGTRHNVDAAHIRSGSIEHGKRPCGMQERDDDFVVPLCRNHHTQQHGMNELAFYALYRLCPFTIAKKLRELSPAHRK